MPTEQESEPARDHVCRGYRRRGEFVSHAHEFLAEGLAAGERVLYVAPGDEAALTGQLRADERCEAGLERGAVQVASVDATYPTGAVVDPAGQVERYAAATAEALAAGFTGLRVAADATSLVRTPPQVDAFARYEYLVDHYMAGHPMSAMCGYDVAELGGDVVAQLACMHPTAHDGGTPFHLHGHARDGGAAALDGDLDLESRALWPVALERAGLRADEGTVVIDAAGLGFADHRSLVALAEYAERHATTVVLRTRLTTPARLVELLDLAGVRVERAA
ncbi:MEDS domain-containing protein [Amycolatopsis sp.]|uniref:MEDS domain-containing protein n=1 Tax=Amycolatopsis sp. TaxID=37632 RepID=UPI002D7F7A59|nr:MEDS domain-containing protein [Amycolatopsis sp.]HET6707109.1 MEDS domain-containing protein [Amycolatopsis sp.]